MSEEKIKEQIKQVFEDLCEESPPTAFISVVIGNDGMVNFASYGLTDPNTVELLEYMIEYFKKDESEDDYGRTKDTTIH